MKLLHINASDLIERVRKRPPLWDRSERLSNRQENNLLLEELWKEVASEMNHPAAEVKKRWRGLRDNYKRELHRLTKNVMTTSTKPIWRYFFQMQFLRDHVRGGGFIEINNQPTMVHTVNQDTLEDTVDSWNADGETDDDDDDNVAIMSNAEFDEHTMSSDSVHCETANTATRLTLAECDEDQAFLISMLPHLTRISGAKKLRCQIEIQDVVCKYANNNRK